MEFISKRVPNESRFTLLDAGCGIGIYAINVLKRFPYCSVLGFDISKEQIDFANVQLEKMMLDNRATFFEGDVTKRIKFNVKNFDFIMCTEVLEHLLYPSDALKNLYDYGQSNTIYVFSVPLSYCQSKPIWYFRQFTTEGEWRETTVKSELNPEKAIYSYYHKEFSFNEIRVLLRTNKYQVLETKFCCFKPGKLNSFTSNGYSKFSTYEIDKILNSLTLGWLASQVIFLCRKANNV